MNIAKTIYNLIINDADLNALIGSRCYAAYTPIKESKPYIVYDIFNVEPTNTKDGASKLDNVYFELRCYAATATGAIDVNNNIRSAIDRFSGLNSGNQVDRIIYESSDGPYFDGETELYRTDTQYRARVRVDFARPTFNVTYTVSIDGELEASGLFNARTGQDIDITLENSGVTVTATGGSYDETDVAFDVLVDDVSQSTFNLDLTEDQTINITL